MNRHGAAVAAAFAAMGILMLAILNFTFSPGFVWFYYPAFAILWWPMAAFFLPGRNHVGFALAGSALTITFLAAVNLQTSPGHLWFLYAVLPLAWWPVNLYLSMRGRFREASLAGGALLVAWFIAVNLLTSPGHPWFLYACYPVLWWPIMMYSGRKAGTLWFSLLCSAVTIAYYAALNLFVSPGYPWAMYPAFAVLWWPMSVYFARHRQWLGYSAAGALLVTAFFVAVNLFSSPGVLWAIYPVFAVLWWPLSVFCARRKRWLGYSVAGALLASVFFAAVNHITSPGTIWAVYPVFAVLWWPLSVYYFKYSKAKLA